MLNFIRRSIVVALLVVTIALSVFSRLLAFAAKSLCRLVIYIDPIKSDSSPRFSNYDIPHYVPVTWVSDADPLNTILVRSPTPMLSRSVPLPRSEPFDTQGGNVPKWRVSESSLHC